MAKAPQCTTHQIQQNNAGAEELRKCKKCGQVQPLSEYYKTGTSKEGRRWICKACILEYQRDHKKRREEIQQTRVYWEEYVERPEVEARLGEYYREYNQRPEVKKRKLEYLKGWWSNEKRRAYYAIRKAIEHGEMKPASELMCADCSKQAKQYFYGQYDVPPVVIPLCFSCHRKRVQEKSMEE